MDEPWSRSITVTDVEAAESASAAAVAAGVTIRDLHHPADTAEAMRLFRSVWQLGPDDATPVSADLMRAFAHTGNYVAGAFRDGAMVAASTGFLTGDGELHSHISGVLPALRDRNVGFALKLYQRAWALRRGITAISWTFDPLVRRNVYFNLVRLGARAVDYLPDFYGAMEGGVNGGDESDRLLLSWPLTADEVRAACAGRPVVPPVAAPRPGEPLLLAVGTNGWPRLGGAGSLPWCQIPADIVALRAAQPDAARAWRTALRETLGAAIRDGARVLAFSREGGYLLPGPR
ncbi:MAG TPA: GNAT family N-acetyltransferase [Micromonosporaceae bacterium]|nr:GNAT family N-acetyltransferase [Micromonosporaceae bacterium]